MRFVPRAKQVIEASRGGRRRGGSHRAFAAALLAPSLAGVCVLFLVPAVDVVRRSVLNDSATGFVGAGNYVSVAQNEAFQLAAANTAKFMVVCLPLLLVLSLAAALFVSRSTPFRRLVKSSLLIPLAIPTFTAALLVSILFDSSGLINGLLVLLGADPVAWLESDWAFWVLVADYLWKNIGYCMVLWLAGLSCIPGELYEAAVLDGASAWRRFTRITLPLLLPSGAVVVILAVINAFKVYREAYLVAGSYPQESMYLIPHLFNNWFAGLSMGKLAAGSVMLCLVLVAVVFLLSAAWRRKEGRR